MRWWHKCRDWYWKHDGVLDFLGLTVIAPCVVYALIYGSLTPHTDGEALVAATLATAGMVIWVARNH